MVERQRADGRHNVTVVRVGVDIDAEPEDAWSVVSDPRNLPHWDRHILAVEGVPAGGLGRGVHYVTVMGFVGMRARVECEVVEWRPPVRSVIRLSGLIDATVSTTLTRLGSRSSRLVHEVDFRLRGGPLGAFAGRSLRLVGGPQLALRRGLLAQKRQIEERTRA
jgi:carbon monoxide dehydrogenase subunit G